MPNYIYLHFFADEGFQLPVKASQILFKTYYTALGMYKLNVFNARKISSKAYPELL